MDVDCDGERLFTPVGEGSIFGVWADDVEAVAIVVVSAWSTVIFFCGCEESVRFVRLACFLACLDTK